MVLKLKKDNFRRSRGGYSRLLNLFCRKCEKLVLVYQKDGHGKLLRFYLDRILSPEDFINLHYNYNLTGNFTVNATDYTNEFTETKSMEVEII